MPEPSHPLAAAVRYGTVKNVDGFPLTIGVALGSDGSNPDQDGDPQQCAFLDSYNPVINDQVMLLGTPGAYCVVGRTAGQSPLQETGSTYVNLNWTDFGGTTRTFLTNLPSITIPDWAMQTGTSTIDIYMNTMLAVITAASGYSWDITTTSTGWTSDPSEGDIQSGSTLLSMTGISGLTGASVPGNFFARWVIPTLASGASATLTPRLNCQRVSGTAGAIRSILQGSAPYSWRIIGT